MALVLLYQSHVLRHTKRHRAQVGPHRHNLLTVTEMQHPTVLSRACETVGVPLGRGEAPVFSDTQSVRLSFCPSICEAGSARSPPQFLSRSPQGSPETSLSLPS